MVIARIREHVATHNWFAVLVDIAIVVLGVFLGTQVNNWNEDRANNVRADHYRVRLADELDFDARQYAVQAAYYRHAQDYGRAAAADLQGTKTLSDADFVLAAYQLTQMDTTRAKTGVYEEMAAAGLTDRLGDEETQKLASDFYLTVEVAQRNIEVILPYRDLLRAEMPYDAQLAIRQQCGDRDVYYGDRLVGIRLVVPCALKLDPATTRAVARHLRGVPGLEGSMTRYIASIDEKTGQLDLASRQARALRKRLLGRGPIPTG